MLESNSTRLRAWKESDLEMLGALRNDIALQAQLMTQARPNSSSRVREWLGERSNASDGVFFVVANKESDRALGYIQALNMQALHGVADFGICLAPHEQRQGYGREALTLLESYLVTTFGMRKLLLKVLATNLNAIRFYQRTGFREIGTMQSHFYMNSAFHDVLLMEKQLPR